MLDHLEIYIVLAVLMAAIIILSIISRVRQSRSAVSKPPVVLILFLIPRQSQPENQPVKLLEGER